MSEGHNSYKSLAECFTSHVRICRVTIVLLAIRTLRAHWPFTRTRNCL